MEIPSVEEVERIASIQNPVIRNLNITECYCEISHAMQHLIGVNPNWCTFAVWASKQAGQSIRKEDILRTYEYYFRHSPEVKLILEELYSYFEGMKELPELKIIKESVLELINPEAVFNKNAKAVAEGNKKVFEEIGREFARFLQFFPDENSFIPENLDTFLKDLKPGNPPDGQQLLKDAFTSYYEAKFLDDIKEKSQMVHYANLLIGFHEQTRLQPDIVEALNAPFEDASELRYKIFKQYLPGFWLQIRYFISRVFKIKLPIDELLDRFMELAKKQVREVITRNLMSLYIPGSAVLRLGSNLKNNFPATLQKITNEKLLELLNNIDPTKDSLEESGAEDWGDLKDRIHFIADFFRSYFEHASLFDMPFTDEQVLKMKAGLLPPGKL